MNRILLTALTAIVAATLAVIASGCRGPKLATADAQMERGEYFDASASYRKIYNKLKRPADRPLRGEVAFKMAEADRRLGRAGRAAAAYRNALRYGYPDSIALLRMATMLHASSKYQEAIDAYSQYLASNPRDTEAQSGLSGARQAARMKALPTRYIVKQQKLFNSRRADFSPVLDSEGRLYFTTTNEKVTGTSRSEVTGTKRCDIWVADKNEQGRWQRPLPAEGALNTEADEGVIAFSPDGRTMYLTRASKNPQADSPAMICTSTRSEASWSEARPIDLITDTVYSYGHPAIDPSGHYLYFVSDRPGSIGQTDIWRIELNSAGAVPENLGMAINTPGREMFPVMRTDSLMYFSSDGHPGMGGLDLFMARLQPSGAWSVRNMGVPLNSEADDFGMTFEPGREAGFFSTSRGDARGYDHIYSFELPDLKINISGYVTDLEEEPIAGATVKIVGDDGSNRRAVTRDDGSFSFPLDRGVRYAMLAGANGYLNARQEFESDTAAADADYAVDFMLASLTRPNVVENIFYDFDKATLRPESTEALDALVKTLQENPGINVEMGSHTDRVGSDAYNVRLSERRAKSVTDYLIGAGIDPSRLSWHGYGKSQPKKVTRRINRLYPQFAEGTVLDEAFIATLSDEDRDAADQINRRTEFRVTSTDFSF